MNDINWLHAIHYYCDRLLELWPGKVALGTALAAILTALGIDHVCSASCWPASWARC